MKIVIYLSSMKIITYLSSMKIITYLSSMKIIIIPLSLLHTHTHTHTQNCAQKLKIHIQEEQYCYKPKHMGLLWNSSRVCWMNLQSDRRTLAPKIGGTNLLKSCLYLVESEFCFAWTAAAGTLELPSL